MGPLSERAEGGRCRTQVEPFVAWGQLMRLGAMEVDSAVAGRKTMRVGSLPRESVLSGSVNPSPSRRGLGGLGASAVSVLHSS